MHLFSDDDVNHENINQLVYLEAAIDENLRMYPPVTRLDRECNEEVKIGDLHFKPRVGIMFPIWAMHHNPEFFPEPEIFRPERFLKDSEALFLKYFSRFSNI